MIFFAQEPLWKSQISTHTTALSDLGDALMTCGFKAERSSSGFESLWALEK